MAVDRFRPLFTRSTLEYAVITTLKAHDEQYIRELETQLGLDVGKIPIPRSYSTRNSLRSLSEEQTPRIIVASTGTTGNPTKDGRGTYTAMWQVGIAAVASGRDEGRAAFLSGFYAAMVRGIMMQYASLGGVARTTDWLRESDSDILLEDADRTMKATVGYYNCLIDDVVTKQPGSPDWVPGGDWPTVDSIIIDMIKEVLV